MIYFVQEVEPPHRIKFGYSKDPVKRVRRLAATLPQKIVLLKIIEGEIEDERFFHDHFACYRVKGKREWYTPDPEILNFVDVPVAS